MKCDKCKHQTGHMLQADECGAGNYSSYCSKGHWHDSGPDCEEEYNRQKDMVDPWINCEDFEHEK